MHQDGSFDVLTLLSLYQDVVRLRRTFILIHQRNENLGRTPDQGLIAEVFKSQITWKFLSENFSQSIFQLFKIFENPVCFR